MTKKPEGISELKKKLEQKSQRKKCKMKCDFRFRTRLPGEVDFCPLGSIC